MDLNYSIKCMICGKPFVSHEGWEADEPKTVSDVQSDVGQLLNGGITIFTDNGNYGSTILDCDEYWTIMFHDDCLKEKVESGGFVLKTPDR